MGISSLLDLGSIYCKNDIAINASRDRFLIERDKIPVDLVDRI
jgi:hypothetical protein